MTRNYHMPFTAADLLTLLISFNMRSSAIDTAIAGLLQTLGGEITAEAGEGLGDRNAAYRNPADGKIYLMDADATTPKAGHIRGFVSGSVSIGQTATLVITGLLDGFSGLTAKQPVYSSTTGGGLTQTRPIPALAGSQVAIVEMGIAMATDTIFINPQPIVYEKRNAMALNATLTINHHADERGYVRTPRAHITELGGAGVALEEYTSGNQDVDVQLRGGTYAGGSANSGTQSGTTVPLGDSGAVEYRQAQSFQVSGSGRFSQFTFTLASPTGSPTGNMGWELRTDSGGSLAGTTILASGTILNASIAVGLNTVNVSNGPILLNSSTYWLVLFVDNQALNVHWNWQAANPGSYANGQRAFSADVGFSWTLDNYDCTFTVTTSAVVPIDKLAQTISIGVGETIEKVELYLKKVSAPTGTATVRLETVDGSNNPTGTLAHANATATFAESSLGTSYATKTVTFTEFTPGAGTYAVVLSTDRAASGTNYVVWGADGSSPSYANGEMKSQVSATWSNEGKDAIFAVKTPAILHPSNIKIGWWGGTLADMVNRYGDGAGADIDTKTTFKCLRSAGFDDVSVQVVLP